MHTAGVDKSFWSDAHIAQTFGHAVVGCVSASIAGGSCGSGAASAGFAAAAGPLLPGADISVARFVSRVIVGGISSRLAGDNFANGATSAAFAYLFNDLAHEMHDGVSPAPVRPEALDGGMKLGEILPFTEAGDRAAAFWADQHLRTGNPLYAVPGGLAALWTPQTAGTTFLTLGAPLAGGAVSGSVNQWVRLGSSYSRAGKFPVDLSLRWGASPRYLNQVPEWSGMRSLNQGLREFRLPMSGWRAADSGHFHFIRNLPWTR